MATRKKALVKGGRVIIYEDIITEMRKEGEAVLVKRIDDGRIQGGQIQRWEVRFIGKDGLLEPEIVERAILL